MAKSSLIPKKLPKGKLTKVRVIKEKGSAALAPEEIVEKLKADKTFIESIKGEKGERGAPGIGAGGSGKFDPQDIPGYRKATPGQVVGVTADNRVGFIDQSGGGGGDGVWGSITGTLSDQTDLQAELDGKADVSHTHVKADITDFSDADYAAASHTHTESDITDLDKYTQAEVTSFLASKSDVGHTHVEADITDLDKYTQAEVDALLVPKLESSQVNPLQNGFDNRTDSTISFNEGTRTFTIAPTGASFSFNSNGTRYSKSGAENIVWDDVEGLHYFYYVDDTLTYSNIFSDAFITDYAFISLLYWDATNKVVVTFGEERHGNEMDSATHLYNHNTRGTEYGSGLQIGDLSTDGSGDVAVDAQCSVTSGVIWDEDIEIDIAGAVAPASFPFWYRSGANGDWRELAANNYVAYNGGTGRAQYNQNTGSTWQLTEVGNNNFLCMHLFATNDIQGSHLVWIVGQNEYTTLGNAREGAAVELINLELDGLPIVEYKAIATLIVQTSTGYSNAVASRVRTDDNGNEYIDWRSINSGVLANIVGASAQTAEQVPFTPYGNLVATDVQAALQELDDEKAPLSHTHVKADITDFNENDYATGAEGDLASSAVQPSDNISVLTNDSGYLTSVQAGDVDSEASTDGYVLTSDGAGGAAWEAPAGGSGGSTTRYEYVATNNQTTFTGADSNGAVLAYVPGQIEVFLNGVLLATDDYTASNGTSIVLAEGASVNSVLSVVAADVGVVPTILTNRNWVINGQFDVWQRGTSGFTTDTEYTSDRWRLDVDGTGAAASVSQQSFTLGQTDVEGVPKYFLRCAVSNGGDSVGGDVSIQQRIEDITKFDGKTVTVSFYAKADGNKDMSLELGMTYGSGGSTFEGGVVVEKVALTTSWQKFVVSGTLSSISGKTLGTNSFLFVKFYMSGGSATNSRHDTLGIQTGTFDIANVMLIEGTHSNPTYPVQTYQEVYNECLRYYYRINGESGTNRIVADGGFYKTTTQNYPKTRFKVPMRTTPTFSYSSLSDFDIEPYNSTPSGVGLTTWSTNEMAVLIVTDPSARTIGFSADLVLDQASSWVEFEAEL